jgi:anhydro-N-acetylmuramic acid kinase
MSGTSMDGIDVALVDLPSNKLVSGIIKKYSAEVQQKIQQVSEGKDFSLAEICQLNTLIGREFAGAVFQLLEEAKIPAEQIQAIGSHGQTVCHDAYATIPYTLQLGCGHTIATLTNITVVADFRTRDLVNGGQGAPFAPIYHQQLFAKPDQQVAVVNIGGIANITVLDPNAKILGWDLGPGNCLMDAWIKKQLGKSYDEAGEWAKKGKVIEPLLRDLLSDPFVCLEPPKSIGKEYYSLAWLANYLIPDYQAVDVQATLLAFTAHCIANSILSLQLSTMKQLYLCGGGSHNRHLITTLSHLLPEVTVLSTESIDINPDYLEAMMFAWLASQTINQKPIALSSITGSKSPQILGAIYQKTV